MVTQSPMMAVTKNLGVPTKLITVKRQVEDQVEDKVENQVCYQIWDPESNQVCFQVWGQVRNQIMKLKSVRKANE